MKKELLVIGAFAVSALVTPAFAEDNVGGCGWGSKLMDGQRGIAPQVLAVTTNGTSGNQTFGISSGTSGCSQDGVVRSAWKTAMYIDSNMNKLARDMSRGQGESLIALAGLLGVEQNARPEFYRVTQENFARLFPREGVSSQEVTASLKQVLAENASLQKYSANI